MNDEMHPRNIFQWRDVPQEKQASVDAILTAGSAFYSIIVGTIPEGDARKQAIDKLIETTMWAMKGLLNPPIPR